VDIFAGRPISEIIMPRLFVALDLPDTIKSQIAKLCAGLSDAKWIGRDQMHLTLRFIGEVDERQCEAMKAGLAGIHSSTFELKLSGVGQFPPRGKPRVLWVGVKAPLALNDLQQKVERSVVALGLLAEDRPFSAHITLARLKIPPPPEVVQQYLTRHSAFSTETISIEQFTLYSSHLTPSGATYRREGVYALSAS
jgi:2'-5' RNA ligase